jgi:hypothetical protein
MFLKYRPRPLISSALVNFFPKFSTFYSKGWLNSENLLVFFSNMLFFALVLHFKN